MLCQSLLSLVIWNGVEGHVHRPLLMSVCMSQSPLKGCWMSFSANPVSESAVHVPNTRALQQMVQELLDMFGLPEDTPVTTPGFHYRDPTLADPGVLTLRQALTSCYDIRYSCGFH